MVVELEQCCLFGIFVTSCDCYITQCTKGTECLPSETKCRHTFEVRKLAQLRRMVLQCESCEIRLVDTFPVVDDFDKFAAVVFQFDTEKKLLLP